ncbi:MAG: tetratricopeptide repeat protein, partial [Planctomycetota bacterium]
MEAEAPLTEALGRLERVLEAGHPQILTTTTNLALLKEQLGDLDAAQRLAERAVEGTRSTFGARHPTTARAMGILAGILTTKGAFAEADALQEEVLVILVEALGPDHPTAARALNERGKGLLLIGRLGEAETGFRAALEVLRDR